MRRFLFVVLMSSLFLSGCVYFRDRVTDAAEIIDLGVTTSEMPRFSLYADGFSVLPVGWSNFDGAFAGLAAGYPGLSSAVHRSEGLIVYGTEQIAYDPHYFNNDEPEYAPEWRTGIIGFMNGPLPPDKMLFSFPIQLHVAWLGAAFNFKPVESVDFILGFALIDIANDDVGPTRRDTVLEPRLAEPPLERYETWP